MRHTNWLVSGPAVKNLVIKKIWRSGGGTEEHFASGISLSFFFLQFPLRFFLLSGRSVALTIFHLQVYAGRIIFPITKPHYPMTLILLNG